jgi:hypothetical protein
MTEQVADRKLYHITLTKPYKRAFTLNQQIRVGDADNPFFAFYEGAREYPITDHNTGGIIQVKAGAWLKQVRDGKINTTGAILANIASEVAVHYVMLCRELLMEEIRKAEFNSEPPSRQRCLYACDSLAEAQYWNKRIGENGTICELTCTGTTHRADARLLLGDSEPLSVTRDRARAYWRGDVGSNPEMETLFVGDALVTQIGL